jgi:hypothetical protein
MGARPAGTGELWCLIQVREGKKGAAILAECLAKLLTTKAINAILDDFRPWGRFVFTNGRQAWKILH